MRTQEEIVARIEEVKSQDFFGWRFEVLVRHLEFEHAKPFLNDDVTKEQWDEVRASETPKEEGAGYVPFAIGKIEDERGISANRSVEKLSEWAWLDGQDQLSREISDYGNYGWYGDAAVRLYVDHYDLEWARGD